MHRFAKLFNDIKLTILSVRRVDKSCSLNLSLFFLFFVLLKRVAAYKHVAEKERKTRETVSHRQVRYACINEEFAYSIIVEAKLVR